MQNSLEDYVDAKSKSWIDLRICCTLQKCLFFLSLIITLEDSSVQNLPAIQELQEMQVWSLDWEDPLKERVATHSSILAWRIPQTEEPGGLQSMGTQRARNDWSNLAHAHDGITHDLLYFYWTLVTFSTGGKYGLGAAHGHECLRACLDLPHSINLTRALLVHMPALEHLMLRWKRKSDYLVISRLKFLFWKLCHVTYCLFQLKRSISKETSTRNRQNLQKLWEFPFRT